MKILVDENQADKKELAKHTVLLIEEIPDNSFFNAFFFIQHIEDNTQEKEKACKSKDFKV